MILWKYFSCRQFNQSIDNSRNENASDIPQSRKAYLIQFTSILTGYVLMFNMGTHLSWSSPALSHLKSEKSQFSITSDQGAMLASIISLSAIIGFMINSIIINLVGRKYSILIFALLHLLSWILINLANSYIFLFIARFTAGLSYGGSVSLIPLYIGEISGRNIRGTFLAFDRIFANLGAFYITILGTFLSYKNMNLVMISLPIISICLLPLMIESPYYCIMKGQDKKAINILMKLSATNKPELVMADMKRMKEAIDNENSGNNNIKELISDRGSRKALIILLLANVTFAFSGTIAIQAYAQEIFKQSGSSLAPEYEAIIITGVQVLAGLPSTQLIDYWGRRPVYMFSGIMSAISLGTVGLFFFVKEYLKMDISSMNWLSLVGLVLYQFMCNAGISTIPTVLMGELLSVKVKGMAVMIASNATAVFMFSSKMMLPLLNSSFGIYTSFWIFSTVCLIGPLVVVYIIPETKGKHLEEILILLNGKKNCKENNNSS